MKTVGVYESKIWKHTSPAQRRDERREEKGEDYKGL